MKLTTLKPRIATLDTRLAAPMTAGAQRLRGRAAVERRERYLRLHPLCVQCQLQPEDRVTVATVVDHRLPLWAGGADDIDANGQALCDEHHGAKSACEARMRAAGGWLSTACSCGQHN